jgi:hypothetical protein
MKLALFAAFAIAAVGLTPSMAGAVPRPGPVESMASGGPNFLVQVRHHHHHRHHWRHWSRSDEPADDAAPEAAGSSAAPESSAAAPGGGKPKIRWVDPERAGR